MRGGRGGRKAGGGGKGKGTQGRPRCLTPCCRPQCAPRSSSYRCLTRCRLVPESEGGSGPSGIRARVLLNQGVQEGQILPSRRCPLSVAVEPIRAPAPPRFNCPGCAVSGGSRFLACSGAAGLRAGCPDRSLLYLPCSAFPIPMFPGLQPRQGGAIARVRAHPVSYSKHQAL
ncbi:hypothetical protein NDU88_002427 [Pleurodeles waltl]|uniref:Uncharacterized protein n=1 Tax=Pleurodeles waltl TaxID=8319 RepID=A0AAV7MRE6_PLEWA|nr:hypothetical protein NDU88_002427 [Pleurodeles waltl]